MGIVSFLKSLLSSISFSLIDLATLCTEYIPGFSLIQVIMVHDYWTHVGERDFVRRMLTGTRAILGWFEQFEDHVKFNGTLGPIPYWSFMDWNLPDNYETNTALYDMFYLKALQARMIFYYPLPDNHHY